MGKNPGTQLEWPFHAGTIHAGIVQATATAGINLSGDTESNVSLLALHFALRKFSKKLGVQVYGIRGKA
jgi:hypothetical protein